MVLLETIEVFPLKFLKGLPHFKIGEQPMLARKGTPDEVTRQSQGNEQEKD
jgi:hypothetical protein